MGRYGSDDGKIMNFIVYLESIETHVEFKTWTAVCMHWCCCKSVAGEGYALITVRNINHKIISTYICLYTFILYAGIVIQMGMTAISTLGKACTFLFAWMNCRRWWFICELKTYYYFVVEALWFWFCYLFRSLVFI